MARPKCCRRVATPPGCVAFKPAGVPRSDLEEIVLGIDEFEAMRLADGEGLYHDEAAERMNVSRQTFGRIISAARRKVTQALVEGKCLRIKGGKIKMAEKRNFKCHHCGHEWEEPFGTGRPAHCPKCESGELCREGGKEKGCCRQGGKR